jgi:SAM-dependent methyltransferase
MPEYMHHRLMHCKRCDVLYADPVPVPEDLGDAYRDAAFDSGQEAAFAARTYGKLIPAIAKKLPDKDGALDIGTGDGAFLAELIERGFTNVVGVEPSTAPIQAADPKIKPLIRHGLFNAMDYAPKSFSLITCFQTIEHLSDPLQACRDVLGLLKPGGAMLIACHNRRGIINTILGMRSPIIDLEHLQLFSPKSAMNLMRNAGYVEVGVKTYVNQYPLHYWIKLLPLPGKLKPGLMGTSKSIGLGHLPMPMPAGNMGVVGYRQAF